MISDDLELQNEMKIFGIIAFTFNVCLQSNGNTTR